MLRLAHWVISVAESFHFGLSKGMDGLKFFYLPITLVQVFRKKISNSGPGVVEHDFSSSSQEAEAGGSL